MEEVISSLEADLKEEENLREHPIELCIVTPEGNTNDDLYLYVKSDMKQKREQSMNSKLTKRFVQELENRDSLILRNATRANLEQAKIYSALNFKQTNPKMRKKP